MTHVLYNAPRGQRTVNPSEEELRYAIFEQPWKEWYTSSNAEATLEMILDDGEELPHRTQRHSSTKESYRISLNHPSLCIKQPEPDEYFFTWFERTIQFVPYNGGPCDEFVLDHCGGEQFKIPSACLVNPDVAFTIVSDFVESQSQSSAVNWVRWEDLPLPDGFDESV